ncbi:Ig-like domain-containing protein [Ulvibacter sp. MAR_2010_11]|uniref:Ig-like domain-containing protein n=1 Tax=Ulvibacter sp. MAR_2010_11 TaxID=1250229 RepID=UPI000C2BED32|nr:Ig-like domain-containing protein [Ulvibacter sp. MAR_2010_11]PKA82746.1 Ig-like domain-containing protein [Ulvibacter sp. MAR_2010_11]
MKHRLLYIPIAVLFLLSFVDCAKKGTPTGGKKDSIPPVIVKSVPENFSINFTDTEIRIYFDEYIKLKNLQTHLIISPPLKYPPVITPLSTSKFIKIKILDTLLPNTTYSINFGQSIVDNNEENAYDYFKYVFSTGSYIDSLKLSGKLNDALLLRPETPTTVMLYEVNEAFKDSLIFSEKPMYITTTRDSTSTFELTNLKEGKYLLVALKEQSNDYTFQPKTDKIGFVNELITLPTDSTYTVSLFNETPDYKIGRPKHTSKNHIVFGFEGDPEALDIELLSNVPEGFSGKTYRDSKSDTLHYWFKPTVENDSLAFVVRHPKSTDTLNVRMRNLYKDSLSVKSLSSGTLVLRDTLKLGSNTPLIAIDSEKIKVTDKDTVAIPATAKLNFNYNIVEIFFPKKEEQTYKVQLLPGAITDFYEKQNDTLNYGVRTKTTSDYGTISLTLSTSKSEALLVQLVDSKFKIVAEKRVAATNKAYFDYVSPGTYYIRVVFDANNNGIWDTGNFLRRLQPEKIVYYPAKIEMLANWSLNETFKLD